jgi:hypothetical protein
MPGVRYGPDIADDAAYVMNNLVDINRRYRETGKLPREFQKFAKLAREVFGVRESDIRKGKYGDLSRLAQYSSAGRSARGKAYQRAKLARSWRTKKIMKRGLRQEFQKRGEKPSGRAQSGVRKTSRGDAISGISGVERQGRGGATYLGRTKTKTFDKLADAAYARARRNKVQIGGARVTQATAASIDKLNIARTGKFLPGFDGQPFGGTGRRSGSSIRPPKSKTAAAASQAKRAKTVKGAGKPGRNSTARGGRSPKRPKK